MDALIPSLNVVDDSPWADNSPDARRRRVRYWIDCGGLDAFGEELKSIPVEALGDDEGNAK